MDVGFIGLGHMGKAIASNLLRAGHRLRVWNRSPAPAQELARAGAQVAAAPADTARAEVLITMLADDAAERAVLIESGVLAQAAAGLIHINMATISVAFSQELARKHRERDLGYVAAPVFGRPDVAAAGKLNTVVAGEPEAVARIEPLLQATSARVWRVGSEPERANAVKLAGNFMIASAIETMGEAAALAQAYGVDAGAFLEILTGTLFASPVYQGYGRLIAERRYEPAAFKLRLGLKDVRLALQAGEARNVPLPFAAVMHGHFLEALAAGQGDLDWGSLANIALRHAGLAQER